MKYSIHLKPRSLKDLRGLQVKDRKRIMERMKSLEDYEDLKDLREAKATEADCPTVPLSQVMGDLLND